MFPQGRGNKSQADPVGPVNVISDVLIRSWRLREAVCAGSQPSRQQNNTSRAAATAPGNEIFSLLGILFEWAALNKLGAGRMLGL